MLKVGLTGGIGCGKSTAVKAFRALGVPIVDADKIAKDIVRAGKPALLEISKVFGDDIILQSGELNRDSLKKKIFSDSEALGKLERVLHPHIRAEISDRIIHHQNISDKNYIIVDIPLLVEKGYQEMFDRIIVVDCLPKQQYERVTSRDGRTESEITEITNIQSSRENRLKAATDILDNIGTIAYLRAQIEALHLQYLSLDQSQ